MRLNKVYLPVQHLLTTALTAMLLTLLVACGTNVSTTTTTGSNGGTNQTTTQATTQTGTPQQCGTVHTMRLLVVPADMDRVKGIEDCFWQAFQQCRPATLVYAQNNLDTGTIHNFSLQKSNATCTIIDGVQHFIAPHPAQGMTTYICTGLIQQADGLHFRACGTMGDVLVPTGGTQ